MSFGTEFADRCLRFEQQSEITHQRGVSFIKMYGMDGKKCGMRMAHRNDDRPALGEPIAESSLDGTITVWPRGLQMLQSSVRYDILSRIELLAILVSVDPKTGVKTYRRKTQVLEGSQGDNFMDFLVARHGGTPNAKTSRGSASELRPY